MLMAECKIWEVMKACKGNQKEKPWKKRQSRYVNGGYGTASTSSANRVLNNHGVTEPLNMCHIKIVVKTNHISPSNSKEIKNAHVNYIS